MEGHRLILSLSGYSAKRVSCPHSISSSPQPTIFVWYTWWQRHSRCRQLHLLSEEWHKFSCFVWSCKSTDVGAIGWRSARLLLRNDACVSSSNSPSLLYVHPLLRSTYPSQRESHTLVQLCQLTATLGHSLPTHYCDPRTLRKEKVTLWRNFVSSLRLWGIPCFIIITLLSLRIGQLIVFVSPSSE